MHSLPYDNYTSGYCHAIGDHAPWLYGSCRRQYRFESLLAPKMGRLTKVSKKTRQALKTNFLANDFNNENQKYEESQEYICSVGEGPVHR